MSDNLPRAVDSRDDVPSDDDISRVVINREVVLDNVLPTTVRREVPPTRKRAPHKESAQPEARALAHRPSESSGRS